MRIDRRNFLQSAAVTGAGLILSPMVLGQTNSSKKPDDINVALLGAGSQGQVLMNTCLRMPGVRFKAICDIWTAYNRKRASRILSAYKHGHNTYVDYKEMLDKEKDLDAVIIATPDFRHAEHTVACLKAGLHVYCESEMSNTLEGAREMLKAAKKTGKLLQIGRQRRSNPRYVHCYDKLIDETELLGQIVAVNGQWNRVVHEPLGWPRNAPVEQAALEKYGYKSMHQFRNWRWYKGLGGGLMADLGSHQVDIYNWFLGAFPKSVMAGGVTNFYDKNSYEWHDNIMVIYEYQTARGAVTAFYQAVTGNSNQTYFEKFMGDRGTLIISEHAYRDRIYPETIRMDSRKWYNCIKRGYLTAPGNIMDMIEQLAPDDLKKIFFACETPFPSRTGQEREGLNLPVDRPYLKLPEVMRTPCCQPHLENFFDAIRGVAKLNCPAEIGYKSAVTVLKTNEAIEAGRRLEFEPAEFTV